MTGGRDRNLVRSAISRGCPTLPELLGALVRREEQDRKYVNSQDGARRDRTLTDDVRVAALESLAPGNLEAHQQTNMKIVTHDEMRHEVKAFFTSHTKNEVP